MNREKTLVLFMVLAIIVYFRGFIIGLIPKSNKVSSAIMGNVNVSNPKPEEERLGALDYSSVQLFLQINIK